MVGQRYTQVGCLLFSAQLGVRWFVESNSGVLHRSVVHCYVCRWVAIGKLPLSSAFLANVWQHILEDELCINECG